MSKEKNMSYKDLTAEQLTVEQLGFIDDMATLMVPWGMTTAVARLYGYLLLQDEPISLDRICQQLDISKSTASVAARQLEVSKLVRRHSERGSKRASYSIVEGGMAAIEAHAAMLGNLAALMQNNINTADNQVASQRLQKTSQVCFAMQEVMQQGFQNINKVWNA
jgi:DNA-binding transcriptional regulator GbsR (MarR family)